MTRLPAFVLRHPRRWAVAVAVATSSVATGAVATAAGTDQPRAAAMPAVAAPGAASTLLVFVSGAVQHPGLYRLAVGARVADAVAAAGGVLPNADPGRLPDLAAQVHDGRQVNVPFTKGAVGSSTARVDANSAAVDELEQVPGMSAALAEAIVQTRTDWGPFANLGDLRQALGLDSATAALIGRHLSFVDPLP